MIKTLHYCSAALLFFSLSLFTVSAVQAAPHLGVTPTSGEIKTTGTNVAVTVDAETNSLKSVSAVITYDATKLTITVANGSFFPNVTTDTTTAGEIVISGTLPIGDTTGVTGSGTLATLTVKPISGATGSPTLAFRCLESSSDDSNLITTTGTNLLTSTAQCAANVGGTYSFSSGSSSTTQACDGTCTTNADCNAGLSCSSGKCRNPSCSTTTSCTCTGEAIAGAQGADTLPNSGSASQTLVLIFFGLLSLSSGVFLLSQRKKMVEAPEDTLQ
ncbi:MAG: LPXTG cell wall anchor domain-containing protein [Candidatus Pacebacteria bacterium]|nr:LPXTG cell wall anchor domain-containing protein [Candidatus Paceibacterota bacterium]PIR60351.1 MAG: hypothetical protein COU67_02555 [Candidatus Pacebacteria bacterium CG10_big_fil_rev_8_21_14_0_10_44_54]